MPKTNSQILRVSWTAATNMFTPSTIHSKSPVPLASTTPAMDIAVAMRKTSVVKILNIPNSFLKVLICFLPFLTSVA